MNDGEKMQREYRREANKIKKWKSKKSALFSRILGYSGPTDNFEKWQLSSSLKGMIHCDYCDFFPLLIIYLPSFISLGPFSHFSFKTNLLPAKADFALLAAG